MKNEKRYIDGLTGSEIVYFEQIDKNGIVVGESLKEKQKRTSEMAELSDGKTKIFVQRNSSYPDKDYKTIGYVKTKEDTFIAIKQKKSKVPAVFFCAIIVILLAALFLLFRYKAKNQAVPDPDAGEYISSLKRPDDIDSSHILIPGYAKFTMKKGDSSLQTVFFNPEGNPCYFKFRLVLTETQEVIYESKLVPPGQGVSPIQLTRPFHQTGDYEAALEIETVDLEDTSINYNGSETSVRIIVEE